MRNGEGLSTSDVARRVGMHPQTLRTLEQQGVVSPAHAGSGQHRVYSQEDVDDLRAMQEIAARYGCNMRAAQIILTLYDRVQELEARCARLRGQL